MSPAVSSGDNRQQKEDGEASGTWGSAGVSVDYPRDWDVYAAARRSARENR